MSMQPPEQRPCPECGGQRIRSKGTVEMWIAGTHLNSYWLDGVFCTVCGHTSLFPEHPGVVIPHILQANAARQAEEEKRLRREQEKQQREQEKQQKRQGR